MKVFPYRTPGGARRFLEAVDWDDALAWLGAGCGRGVTFCEVEMDEVEAMRWFSASVAEVETEVDRLLGAYRNFVT